MTEQEYAEAMDRQGEWGRALARVEGERDALAAELAALRRVVRGLLSERAVQELRERAERAERDLAAFPEPRSMVALDALADATAERDHACADLAAAEAALRGEP